MSQIKRPSTIYLKNLRTFNCFQNKISVMVWFAMSCNGKLPLKFIDKRLKISAEYYKQKILATHLFPYVDKLYPKKNWMFLQDSARSTDPKQYRHFLHANFPEFMKQEYWPPSSPDLNPLDYSIWWIWESKEVWTASKVPYCVNEVNYVLK